jgi:hypothetical protein
MIELQVESGSKIFSSLYSYQHGNYLGNLNFVWKLPSDDNKRSGMKELQVIEQITKKHTSIFYPTDEISS